MEKQAAESLPTSCASLSDALSRRYCALKPTLNRNSSGEPTPQSLSALCPVVYPAVYLVGLSVTEAGFGARDQM